MQPLQAERRPYLSDLLDEALHGPQAEVVGTVRLPAAQLVVEDDPAPVGQRFQRFQVVVGEAGAAVQAQQRRPAVDRLADGPEPDAAARDLDVAFFLGHAVSPLVTGSAAGMALSSKTRFISCSRAGCLARVVGLVPVLAPVLAVTPPFAHYLR